jgi:uncharacterized membrane protein
MRNLVTIAKWSACLGAAGIAACSYGTADNATGGDPNMTAAVEANKADGYGAEANPAVPTEDGNSASAAVPGNGAAATPGDAAPAKAEAAPYHASGSEPFWSLTLGSQMVYDAADGPDITVATPKSKPTRSGPMYVTPEMTVRINQFRRCTEPSGEEVHDTVEIIIGTQKVSGCGEGDPPS